MVERADERDPAFQDHWRIRWVKGVLPVPTLRRNPYRSALRWRYKRCLQFTKGMVVLDIPCGTGWGTSMLNSAAYRVGVDISLGAIKIARSRYAECATFLVGDMSAIPLARSCVNVVVCLEGIEHVDPETARQALQEFRRILCPSGTLLLTSPVADVMRRQNPYHVHEYELSELRDAVREAGFALRLMETHDQPRSRVAFLAATRHP